MSTQSLQDQVAIVTGGNKGYGKGIAKVLKARGAKVWITGRDQAALKTAADELGVTARQADITESGHWDDLMAAIIDAEGRLDILVNNAGAGIRIAPLTEMSDDEIAEGISVNLTGAIYGCTRAARLMKEQGSGTIVNISSVCQRQAWPGWSVYSAAKAGLGQLSNCLYTELRETGVRVTTVIPSWGDTGFLTAAELPDRAADEAAMCIQPEEIGELVAQVCELPAHLDIQDVTLWPTVQPIEPL